MTYKKHFLTQVIVRIDFASPIGDLNKKIPKKFDEEALKLFPIKEAPRTIIKGTVLLSKNGSKITQEKTNKLWIFYDRKKEKKMELLPTHLDIILKKYNKYEELKKTFIKIVDLLTDEINDIVIKRFGLRYINKISINNKTELTNWGKYLNGNLLSIFNIPGSEDKILRALHRLTIKYEDAFLIFIYGIFNPDFPAKIKKKIFILDYDAYYEGLLDSKDLPKYMDSFHKKINIFFEKSITDELRKKMGEK